MAKVFDLTRVEELIKRDRPTFVFVMDTNVLMNTPNPNAWQIEGEYSLFVIPDQYLNEIESIKNRRGHDKTAKYKARELSRNMLELGKITGGIQTQGGWVIGVSSPARDMIQPELDKLVGTCEKFDVSDVKLLLLTKQCNELSISTVATMLTSDRDLYLMAEHHGIPSHLHTGFPIAGLKPQMKKITSLDWWEKAFSAMERTIKERTFEVEVTLTTLHTVSVLLPEGFIVAEGRGIIREVDKDRGFLWTMAYLPDYTRWKDGNLHLNKAMFWRYPEGDADTKPKIHLEFLGGDKPEPPLLDAISERLLEITNPSFEDGKPSVQTPNSVMEQVMLSDLSQQAESSEPVDPSELNQEDWDMMWEPFVFKDWLLALSGDEYDKNVGLLFQAVQNYWQIGDIYTFRIERISTSDSNG